MNKSSLLLTRQLNCGEVSKKNDDNKVSTDMCQGY